MFCRFTLSMPSPLVSCLEVTQELGEAIETTRAGRLDTDYRQLLQRQVTAHSYGETAVLKHLMDLPDNLLGDHRTRTAGYAPIP
jgi:hypothetical protein